MHHDARVNGNSGRPGLCFLIVKTRKRGAQYYMELTEDSLMFCWTVRTVRKESKVIYSTHTINLTDIIESLM